MAFTDVFGGDLIFPSQLSYLKITTAVDITLQWPTEQQITGNNVVADFLDIDATAASINIDMPSASITSTGNKATINNVGANSFDVRDNTGGAIQTVMPGEVWVLVLTDNTTVAGLWSTFQLGATVSVASASALAGAGIKAIGVLLNQKIDSDVESVSPITVVNGDRAKCLIWISGAGQADLPDPGVVGDDWFFMLRNSGTGTLTIVPPSGQIDGASMITLEPNGSTFIFTDGTDFFTVGLTTSSTIGFDFVSIPVPGSGDFVLSGANVDRISYRFTGALTGNRRIVVPNTTQQYWCDNQTTGAFALTISTSAQVSPPELEQGETAIFYSDSVNVINAVNATSISLPLSVVQGGTGANNPTDARNNLEAAHDELDLIAGGGLIGGGTLEADRTFAVGAGIGVGVNPDDVFLDFTTLSSVAPAAGDFIAFQDIDDTDITKRATITDIVGNTSQLVDSAANVRVTAELLGAAQVRSDGNVDAEIRVLEFAHSDGTPRALIGQPTASINLIIANLMTGGAINLTSGPSSSITLNPAGILRLIASVIPSNVDFFADGNSDTEPHLFQFKDFNGNVKGSLGWTSTEAKMHIQNLINGQEFELRGDDFGGNPRTYFLADPDANTIVRADIDLDLQVANGETAFFGTANGKSAMFFNNVEAARTVVAASGGLEADNQSTGAGFERVLTTSDLLGAGVNGAKVFNTVAQSIPDNIETAVTFGGEAYDTNSFHAGGTPTRLTMQTGNTRIRLTGQITWPPNGSSFRRIEVRKNGVNNGAIDDDMTTFFTQIYASAANASVPNLGMQFDTGIIRGVATDFFEIFVLHDAGIALSLVDEQNWFQIEVFA